VLEALTEIRQAAVKCADATVWSLSDARLVEALHEAHAAQQALALVTAQLVRQVDSRDLAREQHATSTTTWLRAQLKVTPQTARRLVELGAAVDRYPELCQALCDGRVDIEQAAIIAAAVSELPDEIGMDAGRRAEAMLIGWAADIDAHGLRKLGRRILEHVAPEIAEAADEAALRRQDARAHQARRLTLTPVAPGQVRIAGILDAEAAAIVNAALDPLCTPRPGDDRSPAQRRADALTEVCRLALTTTKLPRNGGDRPQIMVTMPYDVLARRVGAGVLDTGERLSPAAARRIACDAGVVPVQLGGAGQVLDLGRTRRLISGSLRRALIARDRGCAFPDCDRPARWSEGHHIVSWLDGGTTSLNNAVLLCWRHHRTIHDSDWQVQIAADGLPEFLPPPVLGQQPPPRRNLYHLRT